MIDVFLVDDHPVMRELLREMLETYDDLTIVGEAGTGEAAVTEAAVLQPAAVILDIHLPTLNGIQATATIKRQCPATAVIGITAGEPHPEEAEMMFAAGAVALLDKAEILDALYPSIVEAVTQIKTPA